MEKHYRRRRRATRQQLRMRDNSELFRRILYSTYMMICLHRHNYPSAFFWTSYTVYLEKDNLSPSQPPPPS
jgi:hypothetical protein